MAELYIKIEFISSLWNVENNQDCVHKMRTHTMSVNFTTIFYLVKFYISWNFNQ